MMNVGKLKETKTAWILSIDGAKLENMEVGKNVSSPVVSNKADTVTV
jgi:hypothetical protein